MSYRWPARIVTVALAGLLLVGSSVLAAETQSTSFAGSDAYYMSDLAYADPPEPTTYYQAAPPPPAPTKAPPLPLHTIEGVGGGLAVPLAYLVNPGPEGTIMGMPTPSITYLNTGKRKDLTVLAVTQTWFRRIELGYALARFHLGNLPHVITKTTGLTTSKGDLILHNFNARGLIVEENSFGPWCPSIVAGVQVKYNSDMRKFNDDLMDVPESLGYEKSNGIDYVLTVSKTIPPGTIGSLPPIILTVGARNSKASNFGLTGFGDQSRWTAEFDIVVVLAKNFAVAYEYRGRNDPYHPLPPVIYNEEDLHAIRAAWIINDRMTLAGGIARLGNVANTDVPLAYGLQLKYEF